MTERSKIAIDCEPIAGKETRSARIRQEISGTAPRKATYQDVLDAPDNMVAEIIHGELYLSARPADPHVWAYAKLHGEIEMKFACDPYGDGDEPGEWAILPGPELRLGQDVLVPDSAGWRVE